MTVKEPQPELVITDLYQKMLQSMEELSARDWQLWSICALMIVVVAIGLAAFLLPNLVSANFLLRADHQYLPQLFYGLITLIILFNVYIVDQKRRLDRTRMELLHELVESSKAKETALVDPLTSVFNSRYMEEVFPREIDKAKRTGTDLSFLMVEVNGFKEINSKFGHSGGDQYLRDVATLLKKTFRGSDTVLRLGGDEFMVILPETSNKQALRAAERLTWETRWWNQAGHAQYELSLSCGVATYREGMDRKQVLDLAGKDMHKTKTEGQESFSDASSSFEKGSSGISTSEEGQ